jgi:hypothetical protein
MKTPAQRIAQVLSAGIDGPPMSRGDVAGAYRSAKAYQFKDGPSFFTRKPRNPRNPRKGSR